MTFEKYCTLYLVRHGETDYNKKHFVQGQAQIPLNEQGRFQAKEAAKKFGVKKIDVMYSSDLIRATETAKIIAQEHKLEVILTEAFRERFFGRWQHQSGKNPPDEINKLLKAFYALTPDEQWHKKPFDDYESNEELIGRAFTKLRAIASEYIGKTVMVVTHGGVIRILLAHLGLFPRSKMREYRMRNTAIVELQSDGITFIVKHTEGLIHDEPYL